jgi:hypothetical protein
MESVREVIDRIDVNLLKEQMGYFAVLSEQLRRGKKKKEYEMVEGVLSLLEYLYDALEKERGV